MNKKRNERNRALPINWIMFGGYILLIIWDYIQPGRILSEMIILLSGVIVLDAIYFSLTWRHIQIEGPSEMMAEVGQSLQVKINVKNTAYIPSSYIYLVMSEGKRMKRQEGDCIGLLLGGKEDVVQEITYMTQYCGIEEIGLKAIIIKSFIGFFRKELKQIVTTKVYIVPEIKTFNQIQSFEEFLVQSTVGEKGIEQRVIKNTGDELGYELRPYREGDSEKLIHWKLAALKGEYVVKEREENKVPKTEMTFVLSPFITRDQESIGHLSEIGEMIEHDRTITSFVSLIAYFLLQGKEVEATYYSQQEWHYIKIKTKQQLRGLQEKLSRYEGIYIEEVMGQRIIIKHLLNQLEKKGGIKLMVTSYWQKEMGEYITLHKRSKGYIPVIWTGNKMIDGNVDEGGFNLWQVTDDYDLVPGQIAGKGGTYEGAENTI